MIRLYNTAIQRRELFEPVDPVDVRMYVCGPTVYARPHVGNARSAVVFDVLFRLLRQEYGNTQVTYVRNITDIDDKIIAAMKATGESLQTLTERNSDAYAKDIIALNVLEPTFQPKATKHIEEMIDFISLLLQNGYAYQAGDHVFFDLSKDPKGFLRGGFLRNSMVADEDGPAALKRHPADFVLWKPAQQGDPVWESPFGSGRPGWHIECSAMSYKYFGEKFDIHGGGTDLIFPHHENEIHQGRGAHGRAPAYFWVHHNMVTTSGLKMAKSAGNVITVRSLLDYGWDGETIRYALLMTHYRNQLAFTEERLTLAERMLRYLYTAISRNGGWHDLPPPALAEEVLLPLSEDLNTPAALNALVALAGQANATTDLALRGQRLSQLLTSGRFLGLLYLAPEKWLQGNRQQEGARIEALLDQRAAARRLHDYTMADQIRDQLAAEGIQLSDDPQHGTVWRKARVAIPKEEA